MRLFPLAIIVLMSVVLLGCSTLAPLKATTPMYYKTTTSSPGDIMLTHAVGQIMYDGDEVEYAPTPILSLVGSFYEVGYVGYTVTEALFWYKEYSINYDRKVDGGQFYEIRNLPMNLVLTKNFSHTLSGMSVVQVQGMQFEILSINNTMVSFRRVSQ